jgi:hypothetical protein
MGSQKRIDRRTSDLHILTVPANHALIFRVPAAISASSQSRRRIDIIWRGIPLAFRARWIHFQSFAALLGTLGCRFSQRTGVLWIRFDPRAQCVCDPGAIESVLVPLGLHRSAQEIRTKRLANSSSGSHDQRCFFWRLLDGLVNRIEQLSIGRVDDGLISGEFRLDQFGRRHLRCLNDWRRDYPQTCGKHRCGSEGEHRRQNRRFPSPGRVKQSCHRGLCSRLLAFPRSKRAAQKGLLGTNPAPVFHAPRRKARFSPAPGAKWISLFGRCFGRCRSCLPTTQMRYIDVSSGLRSRIQEHRFL